MGFSVAFDAQIDFCFLVLEVDGLHVSPFDRHPEGDGSLRERGLDGPGWETWLDAVVHAQARLHAIENAPMFRAVQAWERGTLPASPGFTEDERRMVQTLGSRNPSSLWTGEPAVGTALGHLWNRYATLRPNAGMGLQRPIGTPEFQGAIEPYVQRLFQLDVVLVDYPGLVASAITPNTVVVGVRGATLPPEAYQDAIVQAAAQLVEGTQG